MDNLNMDKYKTEIRGLGPHTAHVIFKIVLVLIATLFYTVGNFYGYSTAIRISLGIYIAVPILIHFSSTIQKNLIFLHNVWWSPQDPDYFDPKYHGVEGGRNFYLNPNTLKEESNGIGIWHLLPTSLTEGSKTKIGSNSYWLESLRNSGKPIVMYFHGNMGSRATGHRVDLYKMLQRMDCHVLAFDYCGFADSTPVIMPCEKSTVGDSFAVYKWLLNTLAATGGNSNGKEMPKVYIWGHSLGTSISTHLLSDLQDTSSPYRKSITGDKLRIGGLVLEAPFTNMSEEFQAFPLNMIYKFWPIFNWLFISPLYRNDTAFETDVYIQNLKEIPVVILHASEDVVVPLELGERLYKRTKSSREACSSSAPIYFKRLDGLPRNLAHTFLYTVPKFPKIIHDFFNESSLKVI